MVYCWRYFDPVMMRWHFTQLLWFETLAQPSPLHFGNLASQLTPRLCDCTIWWTRLDVSLFLMKSALFCSHLAIFSTLKERTTFSYYPILNPDANRVQIIPGPITSDEIPATSFPGSLFFPSLEGKGRRETLEKRLMPPFLFAVVPEVVKC